MKKKECRKSRASVPLSLEWNQRSVEKVSVNVWNVLYACSWGTLVWPACGRGGRRNSCTAPPPPSGHINKLYIDLKISWTDASSQLAKITAKFRPTEIACATGHSTGLILLNTGCGVGLLLICRMEFYQFAKRPFWHFKFRGHQIAHSQKFSIFSVIGRRTPPSRPWNFFQKNIERYARIRFYCMLSYDCNNDSTHVGRQQSPPFPILQIYTSISGVFLTNKIYGFWILFLEITAVVARYSTVWTSNKHCWGLTYDLSSSAIRQNSYK